MLRDRDWNSPTFLEHYSELLGSNYLAEIFCKIAYIETDFYHTEVASAAPPFDVPDVLLHMTTTRSAKQWAPEYWREVIDWCAGCQLSVGLIGGKPQVERERYHAGDWEERLLSETALIDLRGETALPQLAGAFARARAAEEVDAGPMHIWQQCRWRWRQPDQLVGATCAERLRRPHAGEVSGLHRKSLQE
jgi:ADP-heptose:LPS heptosyltransferase